MPIISVDIETDTAINGLDPAVAAITEISVSEFISYNAETTDLVTTDTVFWGDEVGILKDTDNLLAELEERFAREDAANGANTSRIFLTWNGASFDIPFIKQRAEMNGVALNLRAVMDPNIKLKYKPLNGHAGGYRGQWGAWQHVDLMPHYAERARELRVGNALKKVYKAQTGKTPIEVDRANMHLLTQEERLAYAASDTRITIELGRLMDWRLWSPDRVQA